MIDLTDDSLSLLFADSNVTTVKDLKDGKDYVLYVTPSGRESIIEGIMGCGGVSNSKVHFYKSLIGDYKGYINTNDKILYNSADVLSIPVWNRLDDYFLEKQWMLGFDILYATVLLPGGVDGYGVYLFFHKQANKRLGVL